MERENHFFVEEDELFNQLTVWLETPKMSMWIPERKNNLKKVLFDFEQLLSSELITYEMSVYPCPLQTGDVIVQIDLEELIIQDLGLFSKTISNFSNFEMFPIEDGKIRFAGIYQKAMYVTPLYK